MSVRLVLYNFISSVIIVPIITLGTHANNTQTDNPRMLNISAQAKSAQEHLEEALEEQVLDFLIALFIFSYMPENADLPHSLIFK